MPRPKSPSRVKGPYAERGGTRFRLRIVENDIKKDLYFSSEEEARAIMADLQRELGSTAQRPLGEAIDEYCSEKEHLGRAKAQTCSDQRERLRFFLRDHLEQDLKALTPLSAAALYKSAVQEPTPKTGRPMAAASHRFYLSLAKTFFAWAERKKYVSGNPFKEVQPVGRVSTGKPQLRIDEARKFVALALTRARTLEVGATAALMQIFLGLRPTEAVIRVVRDLDDQGRVLWVPFGKTSNARRRLQVPEVLREILLQHAHGKGPDAPLLGPAGEGMHTRHALRHRLRQLCAEAEVPQICPHSLRGLNATLALEAGATAHHVAAALGHASFATTARHYADASTVANASLRRVADLLGSDDQASPDLPQLARLLREHLNAAQLQILRDKLIGPDEPR